MTGRSQPRVGAAVNPWRWVLVIPLKDARQGKSRLATGLEPAARLGLVRAMVGDTVAAAAAAAGVDRIVVVTSDAALAGVARRAAGRLGVDVVPEPDPAGLNPAVRAGVDRARQVAPGCAVAVLLADLPALRPGELAAALAAAAGHRLALVTDAAGAGTTLLTAGPGVPVDPAFGPGSARLHRARGHVRLPVPPQSGLASDVDVPVDLAAALALGVGPRTRRALRRAAVPAAG